MKRLLMAAGIMALLVLCLFAIGEEAAHEHEWSDYAVTLEPTCTSTGTEVRICKICGQSEIETLAMKDHEYGSWQYYSDDQHVRKCAVCGNSELQSHDSAIAKTVTAAAENRLGKKSITCAGCGYNYTRLVSVYDRLYTTEGTDVLGNGTAYLKVNTLSLQQGSEKQLTLYSDGSFDMSAITNATVELYARADSGEFRGVKLISGSAELKVTGKKANLDFIVLERGAELQVSFTDGEGSLCLMSNNKALTYIDAAPRGNSEARLNILTSKLDGHALEIELNSYFAPEAVFSYDGASFSAFDAQLIQNAVWKYNTNSGNITASATSGRLMLMSGSNILLNGASSGSLKGVDMPWGWYCLYTSSDEELVLATATYSANGLITGAPENRSISAGDVQETQSQDTPSADEPEQQEDAANQRSYSSKFTESVGTSPKIDLSYEAGTCAVTVSTIPSGYSLTRVEFVQIYGGSIHMKNGYSEESSFTVENRSGKISISAVFTDAKGNEKRVSVCEYDFVAQ